MQAVVDNAASLKASEARCLRAIKDLASSITNDGRPQMAIDGLTAAVDEHAIHPQIGKPPRYI